MTPTCGATKPRGRITVYILTYCSDLELLYGSTLIFKTLRVGFPTADVHVVDNSSLPAASARIRELARDTDCSYRALPATTEHFEVLADRALDPGNEGTVVLLHPDLCFWESCEDWRFDCLIAGRLIPMFRLDLYGLIMMPMLHSQLWWIPDAGRFRDRIAKEYGRFGLDGSHAFSPYHVKLNEEWYRFDPGATLYAAIKEDVCCFGEAELGRFDHLYAGAYLPSLLPWLHEDMRDLLRHSHAWAAGDYQRLRGIWREQEEYFKSRAVSSLR